MSELSFAPKTAEFQRVLVTGGAGFLGQHLCRRLLADGHEVICLDNYFTGRRDNIADLLKNPKFEVVRHDVTNPFTAEVDQIYNLACPASPVHYQRVSRLSALGSSPLWARGGEKPRVFLPEIAWYLESPASSLCPATQTDRAGLPNGWRTRISSI